MNASLAEEPAGVLIEDDYVVPRGWYTLAALLIVALFAFVDRQLLTLAAPLLSKSLHLSDTELGTVQGLAFAIFTVVAVYPLAWAADRYDRRYVLGFCVLIWTAGTVACGLAQNFPQLFAAAVAIAAGEAGLAPITMSIVPDLFHGRKRALANGINYFAAYIGVALALAFGGAAIGMLGRVHGELPPGLAQFEAWRLAFFLSAVPAPLLLVLIAYSRLRRGQSSPAQQQQADNAELIRHVRAHRLAIGGILAALGFYLLAFGGFFVWLPVIATRLFGATPEQNGSYMGLASGIGMIAGVVPTTYIVGKLMHRIGERAPVRLAWVLMLITTPILLAFPFVTSSVQLYASLGVMMFAGCGVGVLVSTILQEMAPQMLRSRFIALYTIVSGLLSGIAPTIVGSVSDALGGNRGLLYALTAVALPSWLIGTLVFRLSEKSFARLAEETLRIDGSASHKM